MDTRIKHLKCGLVNIQSVGNKTLEVRELLGEQELDLFAIVETWLNEIDSAKIAEMTPMTHTFLHVPRIGIQGGGVGMFISKMFSHVRMKKSTQYMTFEHMEISLKCNGIPLLFLIIYRTPPRRNVPNFLEEFELLMEQIDRISQTVYIVGDFNLWMDDPSDREANLFKELLQNHQLVNNVWPITSTTGHTLDLVITDDTNTSISDLAVEECNTISPIHKMITFRLSLPKSKVTKNIFFRNKSDFSPSGFVTEVADKFNVEGNKNCIHDNSVTIFECSDCLVETYNKLLKEEYNNACPMINKTIVIKDQSPWFNGEILNLKREKRRKEHRWHRLKTNSAYNEYKSIKNRYIYLIKKRKMEYYEKKIQEAGPDMNRLYKILNGLTGKSTTRTLPDGYNSQDLANAFSEFFKTKINNIIANFSETSVAPLVAPRTNETVPPRKLTRFEPVEREKLQSIFMKTKKTYCALDPIPISDLTNTENLSLFLNIVEKIVNCSVVSQVFPEQMKYAVIHPAVKGSMDPQSLNSYRPISNLPFLSKLLEYVILDQLWAHLETTKVLPDSQSAYRQLYSTETTVCSVVNDLLSNMDEGKCSLLVLLDLSAAFDTVVHELLIDDLRNIGVENEALNYLKSYLLNRQYCVQIGESFSTYEPLTRGVPQGSVLGPILFCIYTIGLANLLRSLGVNFKLFADDTQLYLSITDINTVSEVLNNILKKVKEWMDFKHLKLNEDKTEFILIGKKERLREIDVMNLTINGNQVNTVDVVRDLGVLIDSNLTFNNQINNVVRVAGFHLRNIAFVKKYIDEDSLKKLVINNVISKVDYCNSIYYGLPKYQLYKLQKILNRAARLIKGVSPRDRITPTLIELHWLPIKARIKYKICVLSHQAVITGCPGYLREKIDVIQPSENNINTRSAISGVTLKRRRPTTNYGSRAFKAAAPIVYNSIPVEIRNINNMKNFKAKLKTFIFSECYDLEDQTVTEQFQV